MATNYEQCICTVGKYVEIKLKIKRTENMAVGPHVKCKKIIKYIKKHNY